MTALWHFYWPVLIAAAVFGLVAGTMAFRTPSNFSRNPTLAGGVAASLLLMLLWHLPGGAERRLAASIERSARVTLDNYEMTRVTAKLERRPLRRTLILSGPGNDFQQLEMVRIMNHVPGVAAAKWDRPIEPRRTP
jgi:hypothetical protein